MTEIENLSAKIKEVEIKIKKLKDQLEFYEQQQKLFQEDLIKILKEKLGGVEKIDRN
jgi:hypothetical protein